MKLEFIFSSIMSLFLTAPLAALDLVRDGKPQVMLVLPAEPSELETKAATEIQEHVRKISGATLEMIKGGGEQTKSPLILLGTAADARLEKMIKEQGDDPAAFALVVDGDRVAIRGLSAEGTLFGAYELLEQLGVRWFMPGELGTVLPKNKTLTLKGQQTIQVPSFHSRWHGCEFKEGWAKRMRMGGPYFPDSHGIPLGTEGAFEKHPEFYALVGGKREKPQLCISNPEVVRLAIQQTKMFFKAHPAEPWTGMGPADGSGFCECDNCRALDGGDWDAFSNESCVTDRYIWFFNQILKGIEDEFPDRKIGFYCYHTYMRPPVKTKPDPRIVPAFAPIALCRVHGMSNPVCPERSYYRELMVAWKKILPDVYERGYWFNLADPGFPFSHVHRLRDEIPTAKQCGIKGWRVETVNHWGSETPSLYIAAKLMWNHQADVDALVQDFCDRFFGSASKPMKEYLELMDHALRDADYHTGCSFDMPFFYPKDLRDKARALLSQAEKRVDDGIFRKRVQLFRTTFDYIEAFIRMIESRNAFHFAEANEALQKVDALRTTLLAYDPPMVHPSLAESYLKRFFRDCTEQGFKRTTDGNQVVASFATEWDFLLDPLRVGEDCGWWRKDLCGGNWQRISSRQSWGDQGLRYYKGLAWYRQKVNIPREFEGHRVFLWFGGVDEKAKVWLNGRLLGVSHSSAFIPFEVDATPAMVAGGENTVTVCVCNMIVNELGTGGIMAPVMFYAPAAGKDAQLENTDPLGRTFP